MPVILNKLTNYQDESGNSIEFDGCIEANITITFSGSNNKMVVKSGAKIKSMIARFDCDNGYLEIGNSPLKARFRVGLGSKIVIGDGVTTEETCFISTAEYSSVTIGDDCMIATSTQLRSDDAHPIFDVETGNRINMPMDIVIGNHVWIAARAVLLAGTQIKEGSVVGFGSIVKGKFPNNCVIAGTPARVVRRNIAWERPHLTMVKPHYKPDASSVKKSAYWNKTVELE